MSALKRLFRNTFSMFVAQGLQPIMSLILVFIIARILGPEIFGKYIIIFQLFSIFQITSSFGLKTLLTREVAADKKNANKYLVNGFFLGLPASIINITMLALMVVLLNYDSDVANGAYLIAIALIASALMDVFSGVLSGFEEIQKIAHSWIVFLILKTSLSIAILLLGYGLYGLIIVHVVTKFLQTALLYYFISKRFKKIILSIDRALCKKLISMGWNLALLAVSVSLFWRADSIMLSKMVTHEMVGNYGAAYKVFHFMLMAVRSFFMAFFPLLSSFYIERRSEFRNACRKAIRYLVILIIPISILVTYFSSYIMPYIWGSKFDNAIVTNVLIVMTWSLLPFAISEVLGTALIASKNQGIHVIFKIVVLFVKVVLNYFLILRYGVIGPAIATLISLMVLVILQIPFVIPKLIKFRINSFMMPLFKIILSTICMILVIYLLNEYHYILVLPISFFVYLLLLFITKIFSPEDQLFFRRIIKKSA